MEEIASENDGIATNTNVQPKRRFSKKFIILIVFLVFFVAGMFIISKNVASPSSSIKNTIKSIASLPTDKIQPTPYPFYELTIPSLKSKTFTSNLGELKEVGTNDEYASYVTSFTSEGLKINGLLTRPAGEEPKEGWPAIVFIHGYIPPKTYQTQGQPYSRYVDYLARNGFVVFKIDLRGHGDSEGEPGGAYYSSDYVIDALNAYAALAGADFVNREKIGLWGHSMAGNVSLRALATKPEIPAVVIWGGAGYTYTDLAKYRISDASYDPTQSSTTRTRKREQIRKLYGDPDPSKPFWHDMAATNYLEDIKGAVALHHAVDDNVVDVRYSQDLAKLLEQANVEHEFYEYSSGGHNIMDPSFTTAMERTVAFYKKHL